MTVESPKMADHVNAVASSAIPWPNVPEEYDLADVIGKSCLICVSITNFCHQISSFCFKFSLKNL